ncbi:IclR family transcriptional regulator [Alishewanella sp. d11]|uniref:IclR family transcriptional regulator n=1 Tax=Alishewanella sp. d11 TaxID=3414030 RepID=UPI003BF79B7B
MVSYVIPNLANACRILSLVSESEQGLSLTELEQRLAIPRTTTFRILQTLCQQQLLEKQGKRYQVGTSLFKMSFNLVSSSKLSRQALPFLQKLALSTGMTAQLSLPHTEGALIVEVCDSPNPLRMAARPGTIASFNCSAAGKIFLAFLHFDKITQFAEQGLFTAKTQQSLVAPEELKLDLQRILGRGYATDDQEYHQDVRCLSAPIRDERGAVVAAITVTAPTSIFARNQFVDVAQKVKKAAIDIGLTVYRPQLAANQK